MVWLCALQVWDSLAFCYADYEFVISKYPRLSNDPNMTNLVNPVGKIEKPLLDATTCLVFGVCIDFPFGIKLGI